MVELQIPAIDLSVTRQMVVVFAWAIALLVADLWVPAGSKRITGYLALAGVVVAAAVGVPQWGVERSTFADMVRLDNYALSFNWLFLAIAAITILISLDYLPRQGIERGEYYVLILIATGGMMVLAQGTDLITLFLGLELLSITLYVLAGFAYPRLASAEAAMKYLIIGAFAAGFLVFGIALSYGAAGSSNLAAIDAFLRGQAAGAEQLALAMIGAGLVIVGFGYKIAMAPFHMWTPDVYEGSPTPVAALMSVGTKAAGFAALTRFLLVALPSERELWVPVLAALAAVTMIVGNLLALSQRNVKRMLAYSSIGHAGYVLTGVLAGSRSGVEGMLFYLLAYALTNLAAFAVLVALEQRGEAAWDLDGFNGLGQRAPWLAVAMAVAMLSLAGIPPTAGFFGKLYVFSAAWGAGLGWLVLVGVLTSAIAAFFYLRIIVRMFTAEPERAVEPSRDRGLQAGLVLATVGVVVFGLLPALIVNLVQQAPLLAGQ